MHKKLCLQGLVATEVPAEVSRVEDVYFFTDFNMIEISRLLDGSITTDVEVYYRVPWYLIFYSTFYSTKNGYYQLAVNPS